MSDDSAASGGGSNLVYLEHVVHEVQVADVAVHKAIVGHILHVSEVVECAAVVEHVQVDDGVLGVLVHDVPDHVTADKARTAAKEYDAGGIRVRSAADGRI